MRQRCVDFRCSRWWPTWLPPLTPAVSPNIRWLSRSAGQIGITCALLVAFVLLVSCERRKEPSTPGATPLSNLPQLIRKAKAIEDIFEQDTVYLRAPEEHPVAKVGQILQDSRGRFILVGREFSPWISVFDSSGNFLYTVGRRGSGPGEYRWVRWVALDSADNVWVLDPGNLRMSIFDTTGSFQRAFELESGVVLEASSFVPLGSGEVLFHTPERPLRGDSTFVVTDNSGAILRKFGHTSKSFVKALQSFPLMFFGPLFALANNRVYEGDWIDYPVRVYERSGRFLGSFGQPPISWRCLADADFSGLPKGPSKLTADLRKKWDRFTEQELSRCVTPGYLHLVGRNVLVRWYYYGPKNQPDGIVLRFTFYDLQGQVLNSDLTFRNTRPLQEEGREQRLLPGPPRGLYLLEYEEEAGAGARLLRYVPAVAG